MVWKKATKCRFCGEKIKDAVMVTKDDLTLIVCPRCIIAIIAVVEDTLPFMIGALQKNTKAYKAELVAMGAKD